MAPGNQDTGLIPRDYVARSRDRAPCPAAYNRVRRDAVYLDAETTVPQANRPGHVGADEVSEDPTTSATRIVKADGMPGDNVAGLHMTVDHAVIGIGAADDMIIVRSNGGITSSGKRDTGSVTQYACPRGIRTDQVALNRHEPWHQAVVEIYKYVGIVPGNHVARRRGDATDDVTWRAGNLDTAAHWAGVDQSRNIGANEVPFDTIISAAVNLYLGKIEIADHQPPNGAVRR